MELPNLLATQVQSYDAFLQRDIDSDKRANQGLEQVLNSKSQMLKLCNPVFSPFIFYSKIVTSNPGFGINYFFLADMKH